MNKIIMKVITKIITKIKEKKYFIDSLKAKVEPTVIVTVGVNDHRFSVRHDGFEATAYHEKKEVALDKWRKLMWERFRWLRQKAKKEGTLGETLMCELERFRNILG